ncbi:MAG: formate dehydrogenase [Thermodesulfobacteriota bacterium]
MKTFRLPKRSGHWAGRRTFLQSAVFLGAAVAAVIPGLKPAVKPTARKPVSREGTRYELTDHIRKYYEKCGL